MIGGAFGGAVAMPGKANPGSQIPSFITASPAALAKLQRKAERSKTAMINVLFLADSNNASYNGTNAESFFAAWTADKIDKGLQSWRDNVAGGPQNNQSSCIEIPLTPCGIDPVNSYNEAPWNPLRSNGGIVRRWYGDQRVNPGGLGQLPYHDQYSMLGVLGGYYGFIVDRTATGERFETNKTKASIIYGIRGGNPDIGHNIVGATIYGADGTNYPYPSLNGLFWFSPFKLEFVDITGVDPANYGTTASYANEIIDPVFGAPSQGWKFGYRSAFLSGITNGIKTLVRVKPIANSCMKLDITSYPITLAIGGTTAVIADSTQVQAAVDTCAGANKVRAEQIDTAKWLFNSLPARYGGGAAQAAFTISAGTATCIDVSGGGLMLGMSLEDGSTVGVKVRGLESSGASETILEVNGRDHTSGAVTSNPKDPQGWVNRIRMMYEDPYNQPEYTDYYNNFYNSAGAKGNPAHNAVGLDILVTALLINSMGNYGIYPVYVGNVTKDLAAVLDARTGNNETVWIIHLPPCPEGSLSTTRDDFFTTTGGLNFNDYRNAILAAQAAYPNTIIVVDHQAAYGNVAPSVMKLRYGKGGYGRTGTVNQTNPLHFDDAQYGDRVAEVTTDICIRLSYVS